METSLTTTSRESGQLHDQGHGNRSECELVMEVIHGRFYHENIAWEILKKILQGENGFDSLLDFLDVVWVSWPKCNLASQCKEPWKMWAGK